jgi:peptide deformylase
MHLPINTIPDPILRRKAHKVESFDKGFRQLVANMIETMREAPGVGLAAPQIGESIRLIVVEYGDDEDESVAKKLYILANPEILSASDEKVMGVEACLSVPGLAGEVNRHESIVIRGQNRLGKQVKIKASGWMARIFQHEMDHLDGILFTDRAEKVWQPKEGEVLPAD